MAQQPLITYGKTPYEAKAIVPGPQYVELVNLTTVQPVGSFTFDNVIEKGEKFDIVLTALISGLLSDLEVDYIVNVNSLNFDTGNRANPYSFELTGKLPGGGVTTVTIRHTLEATETGVFLLSAAMGFPHSRLFDFTLGSIAGSEGPIAGPPRLRIANFYVYER